MVSGGLTEGSIRARRIQSAYARQIQSDARFTRAPLIAEWRRLVLAVLLNARGAQSGKAVLVDGVLPGQELFNRQGVAAAGLFERQQPAADSGDHFGFAADDPTFRPGRRQIDRKSVV